MRSLFAGVGILGLMTGCAAFAPKLETPQLSVVNVQMLESTVWEQRLKVRMRVRNPNERALPVKGLSYRLEVAGEDLARGLSDAGFTVPALGDAEFDMTLTTNMAATLVKLLGRRDDSLSEALPYRIVGKISLAEGLLRSLPFDERGELKLK